MAAADLLQHACLSLAGANVAAAAVFAYLYLRRRQAVPEYLPFALLCLGIAAYDVFAGELYVSRSVEEGVRWQRWQILSFGPINLAMLWFMGLTAQSGLERKRFDRGLLVFGALFVALTAAFVAVGTTPLTLSPRTPLVKVVTWDGSPVITYFESDYGPLLAAGQGLFFAGFFYAASLVLRAYRRTGSRYLLAVLFGLGVYVAGLVFDTLVGLGRVNFVYTSEYAYLALVTVMSAALIERFVRLHGEVEALNAALAQKVAAAERQIAVLHDLIPICSHCKKIRGDDGFWQQVDEYFAEHHDASFTHGVCPDCIQRHYPDVAEFRRQRAARKTAAGE